MQQLPRGFDIAAGDRVLQVVDLAAGRFQRLGQDLFQDADAAQRLQVFVIEQILRRDFGAGRCFGERAGARRTVLVTLSGAGELLALPWPRAGLPLAF